MTNITKKEINFLKEIDKRVRKEEVRNMINPCPNMGPQTFSRSPRVIETYLRNNKLTSEEINNLVRIVEEKRDIAFYPTNTEMGFAVGYELVKLNGFFPGVPMKKEVLLRFLDSQLPKNYDFAKLSETFMKEKNLSLAEKVGVKIKKNYSHYDY